MANELYQLGFKLPEPHSIKPKHVHQLIEQWQASGLSAGTIKNRVGWMRWWTQKVNKASILPRSNRELGLTNRTVHTKNRAFKLDTDQTLTNPRMQLALELMQSFGLRFEEALKLRPHLADQQTTLRLKPSWTKGGRARTIPIRTDQQRELLKRAIALVGNNSLIPTDQSYIKFRKAMEHELAKANIKNIHGLRHAYAQQRYFELSGRACPQAGGPTKSDLTIMEQRLDEQVRRMISEELGHSRLSITRVYLG